VSFERKRAGGELARKLLHVVLALLLLVPLSPWYGQVATSVGFGGDAALSTYALLLVAALFVSTLRVRKPELRDSILRISREARRVVLQHVKSLGSLHEVVEGIEQALDRAEQGFFALVDAVERDYEKRYGYVAAICAVASVLASYALFGPAATARGILALAVVDPVASLLTLYLGGRRILKHNPVSVAASALAFSAALLAAGERPLRALLLGAAASLIELVSPEDNLTLPLGTAALSYLLELSGA
jgi:dolichol kinase